MSIGDEAEYTDQEWRRSFADRPLGSLELEQIMLLHRHWVWMTFQRELHEGEVIAGQPARGEAMAADAVAAMYLWYALLWTLIEGFQERAVDFAAEAAKDIDLLSEGLRRCRNAVFHVPRRKYYDDRLFDFMADPGSGPAIRRLSSAFGTLFLQEFDRRGV